MAKSEVYSWRLTSDRKAALEAEARAAGKTIAEVLDGLADEWLAGRKSEEDEAEQRRLHEAAAKCVGAISGGDPNRSENVSTLMRQGLRKKYGR
jgi:hypothetical protein